MQKTREGQFPEAYYEGLAAFPKGERPYNWHDGPDYHWWMCGWFDAQGVTNERSAD